MYTCMYVSSYRERYTERDIKCTYIYCSYTKKKHWFSLCFLKVRLKTGSQFPAKNAKIVILSFIFGPPGVLHRIYRIFRKWSQAWQNRPWVPRAWEQDDGSLHKLPQIKMHRFLLKHSNLRFKCIERTLIHTIKCICRKLRRKNALRAATLL